MKKRITRGLIALLAIVMCAATVQAQTTPTSGTAGPLTWKYDTGTKTLTISGKGEITGKREITEKAPWNAFKETTTNLVIEEGVTSIGGSAFEDFTALISVTFPKSLTRILALAFDGCNKLPSVKFPDSMEQIGYLAFNECESLTSVELPKNLSLLAGSAFRNCVSLTSVTIPAGVKRIIPSAFEGCKNLKSLTVDMKTPPNIKDAFKGVPVANVTLTVPKGSKAAYEMAPVWKEFKQIAESTVANAALPEARIYAAEGLVYLTLPQAATVRIYNLNGVLVRSLTAPAGLTTVALPTGIYIVRAGDKTEKVFVN